MIVSPCTNPWCLSAQNISFIPQRFCTVVILGALNMPGYGHLKQWNQLLENYDVHFHAKNQIYPSTLSRNIAKILQTYYFWYFGHAWPRPSRHSSNLLGTSFCLHVKNKLDPSLFSWDLALQRMLQSVWPRAIGPITWEAEFHQIKGLQRNINIFHLRLSTGKTNDKIF